MKVFIGENILPNYCSFCKWNKCMSDNDANILRQKSGIGWFWVENGWNGKKEIFSPKLMMRRKWVNEAAAREYIYGMDSVDLMEPFNYRELFFPKMLVNPFWDNCN